MPIFVTLGNFTEKGKAMLKDVKTLEEYQAGVHQMVMSYGGKLLDVYLTMGQYDYIMIMEFPSEEVMLKMLMLAGASGNSVTETITAVSIENAIKIMKAQRARQAIEPYKKVKNRLIKMVNEDAYTRKETIIEALTRLFEDQLAKRCLRQLKELRKRKFMECFKGLAR